MNSQSPFSPGAGGSLVTAVPIATRVLVHQMRPDRDRRDDPSRGVVWVDRARSLLHRSRPDVRFFRTEHLSELDRVDLYELERRDTRGRARIICQWCSPGNGAAAIGSSADTAFDVGRRIFGSQTGTEAPQARWHCLAWHIGTTA